MWSSTSFNCTLQTATFIYPTELQNQIVIARKSNSIIHHSFYTANFWKQEHDEFITWKLELVAVLCLHASVRLQLTSIFVSYVVKMESWKEATNSERWILLTHAHTHATQRHRSSARIVWNIWLLNSQGPWALFSKISLSLGTSRLLCQIWRNKALLRYHVYNGTDGCTTLQHKNVKPKES